MGEVFTVGRSRRLELSFLDERRFMMKAKTKVKAGESVSSPGLW